MMTPGRNVVESYLRATQSGPPGEDELVGLFAPEDVYVQALSLRGRGRTYRGRDAIPKALHRGLQWHPPDFRIHLERVDIDGEELMAAWTCTSAALPHPMRGVDRYTIRHGLIDRLDLAPDRPPRAVPALTLAGGRIVGRTNDVSAPIGSRRLQGRGVIHNMSSSIGFTGFPGLSGYTSTKGAIESLTRTLALELRGSGISIGIMQPPLTTTQSSKPLPIPAQAMADPEAVGRKLAGRIMSRRPSVAAGFCASAVVTASRICRASTGRGADRASAPSGWRLRQERTSSSSAGRRE